MSWTALILAYPSGLLFTKRPVYESKHFLSWPLQQVRNFLESTLVDLRHLWMKRIGYQMCFACPCERVCEEHKLEACSSDMCLHFLHMDECLANKVRKCSNPPPPPPPKINKLTNKKTNKQKNKKSPCNGFVRKKSNCQTCTPFRENSKWCMECAHTIQLRKRSIAYNFINSFCCIV